MPRRAAYSAGAGRRSRLSILRWAQRLIRHPMVSVLLGEEGAWPLGLSLYWKPGKRRGRLRAVAARIAALPAASASNVKKVLNRAAHLALEGAMSLETAATVEGFLDLETASRVRGALG